VTSEQKLAPLEVDSGRTGDPAPPGSPGRQGAILHFSSEGRAPPELLRTFAERTGARVLAITDSEEVLSRVNRSSPLAVVLDGGDGEPGALQLCRTLKADTFTAVIPLIVHTSGQAPDDAALALEAGADEVITALTPEREAELRLHLAIWRADRDLSVNPTTRLPGTVQIDRDFAKRLQEGAPFAVCYADLDHFKEFNDRYGYNEGDRVIRMLARILRDVVKGYCPRDGFIGHIGGDDFIFNVPLERMRVCCEEIIALFDEFVPFQYTEEDRRAGYFLGRDRRGNILWVPLMTLSIGVVTNEQRAFTHTARVSELATEMKTFAKKLPGSVYAVDRRTDAEPGFFGRPLATPEELESKQET
jgi:GGDEF domain-containing protein